MFKTISSCGRNGNVRSLTNKVKELGAPRRTQLEYRVSIMCFTKTWLQEYIPDSTSAWLSVDKGRLNFQEEQQKQV